MLDWRMLKIENERIEAVKKLIKEILVRISPDCQNVDVVFDGFQEGIDRYFVNLRYLYFPSLKLEFDNFRTTDKYYIEDVIRRAITK